MNVVFTSRHMDVSPALRQYAEERAEKLGKFYDRIQEVEVVIDAAADKASNKASKTIEVEMIVNGEQKNLFIAKTTGDDAYGCIDHCYRTLERQLTDHHKKVKNRKHPGQ